MEIHIREFFGGRRRGRCLEAVLNFWGARAPRYRNRGAIVCPTFIVRERVAVIERSVASVYVLSPINGAKKVAIF